MVRQRGGIDHCMLLAHPVTTFHHPDGPAHRVRQRAGRRRGVDRGSPRRQRDVGATDRQGAHHTGTHSGGADHCRDSAARVTHDRSGGSAGQAVPRPHPSIGFAVDRWDGTSASHESAHLPKVGPWSGGTECGAGRSTPPGSVPQTSAQCSYGARRPRPTTEAPNSFNATQVSSGARTG
jgi:hypothetical protein